MGAMECRRWVGAASDSQHWWEGAGSKRGSEGVRVWGASVGDGRGGKGEKEDDGIGLARADAV